MANGPPPRLDYATPKRSVPDPPWKVWVAGGCLFCVAIIWWLLMSLDALL